MLRAVHGLRSKEVTAVIQLLGTSEADRVERAVDNDVRVAKRAAYLAREKADAAELALAALPQVTPVEQRARAAAEKRLAALRRAAADAERAIAAAEKKSRASPDEAIARQEAAAVLPARRTTTKEASEEEEEEEEPLALGELVAAEALGQPVDQSQAAQLRYRLSLQQRCGAAGHPGLFALWPLPSFTCKHVPIGLPVLRQLLLNRDLSPSELAEPRVGTNTFECQLLRLLSARAVKKALHGGPGWRFGCSGSSDGESLCINLVNGAQAAIDGRRKAAAQAGKKKGSAVRAAGVAPALHKPKRGKTSGNAPKKARSGKLEPKPSKAKPVVPAGAYLVGMDPGNHNVIGAARYAPGVDAASGARGAWWTVSTKQYRELTGEAGRARAAKARLAARRVNEARSPTGFTAQEAALLAHPATVSDLAECAWALRVRHGAWGPLFSLFGSRTARRDLMLNYTGRKRVLSRLAHSLLVPGARTVILCGDAEFSSTFGGKNGAAGPMVRAIKALRAEGVTVFDADEHRSSMVDHGAAGRCVLPHSRAWSHSKQLWLSIGAASRVLESHSTRCRVLYNPVCEKTRTDPQGREHIVRPHGLKQSSAPGRHVTMGRDKNAPANFVIRHQALVATGEVPWQFQRGTELEFPEARSSVLCTGLRPESKLLSRLSRAGHALQVPPRQRHGQAGALGQAGCGRLRTTKTNLHYVQYIRSGLKEG
jgi:hypothetical protein